MAVLNVPAAVGVPPILLPFSVNPAGSPVADHAYVPEPPVAERVAEYAVPAMPDERLAVVMAGAL
jgi:hypothetical protein